MPEMRPRPTAKDAKIKILECSNQGGIIPHLGDMTMADLENGDWREIIGVRKIKRKADREFIVGVLESAVVKEVSDGDVPPANMIWILETNGSLEIWKTGGGVKE